MEKTKEDFSMFGNSSAKKGAPDKLENQFSSAVMELTEVLGESACHPKALFGIFKNLMWSLQFAAPSQEKEVMRLWVVLMEVMRSTREHCVREWTYEVLVEFTTMRHLVVIARKYGGFRCLKPEYDRPGSVPVRVSSGADIIVETMLVRLALCISQRFPELAAEILLDYGVAQTISKMISNEALSRELREEVSRRFLKLSESVEKGQVGVEPAKHQRVNELRNPGRHDNNLRQQQHQQRQLQEQHQEKQQHLEPGSHIPDPALSRTSPVPEREPFKDQGCRPRQQQHVQMQAQPAQAQSSPRQQAHQPHRQVQQLPFIEQVPLLDLEIEREPEIDYIQEADRRLNRHMALAQDLLNEALQYEMLAPQELSLTDSGPGYLRPGSTGGDEARRLPESWIRDLDCSNDREAQREHGRFEESQRRGMQNSKKETMVPKQNRQVVLSPIAEEPPSPEITKVLGPAETQGHGWIDLPDPKVNSNHQDPQIAFNPPHEATPCESVGVRPKMNAQLLLQAPPPVSQSADQNGAMAQEKRSRTALGRLMHDLPALHQVRGEWSRENLQRRDNLHAWRERLLQKLETLQQVFTPVRSKAAMDFANAFVERLAQAYHAAQQRDLQRNQIQQQMFMGSPQMMNQVHMPQTAPAAPPGHRSLQAPAQHPAAIWQLPCEDLIRLQAEQGGLNLPPEVYGKYSVRQPYNG